MILIKKVINATIRVIEYLTKSKITVQKLKNKDEHPLSASKGDSMGIYCNILENLTTYSPNNVFEIGANFGQDAEYLRHRFNLDKSQVYIFEAHPQILNEAKKMYGFNSFSLAASDKIGRSVFHCIDLEKNPNSGISSLRVHTFNDKDDYIEIEVECIRMDKFILEHNIDSIDFLKIDVEGASFEVLLGFGSEISKVKAIQVESENVCIWQGQYLFKDTSEFLVSHGFELVHFELKDGVQSDSFWIKKNLIKNGIKD